MVEISYTRDNRSPTPLNPTVSKVMSSVRSKDSQPELKLRRALTANGMSGYRIHWTRAPGRPDISYPGRALAIFVHGCYWHRCPECQLPLPRNNRKFWKEKFERNQERDERKIMELAEMGWTSMVLWECWIKSDIERCIEDIREKWED